MSQISDGVSLSDFDFGKPINKTRIVVAMSGGVDSSVTAALLKDKGYDVIGVTLQLYNHGEAISNPKACCAGQDIYDAKQVASRIDIPHYVLDYESLFRQEVIDDFADSYVRGETPLPCVRCNQSVKFRDLFKVAKDLGADALATGHYVQRKKQQDGYAQLHKGIDLGKDQSYFLFSTTSEQLAFLRFPLGGLTKPQTRQLAHAYGLKVADKPDSQDICFVPNGGYADLVAKLRPNAAEPGDIVHIDGRTLGKHQGIIYYTVGQRKGLGIGGRRQGDKENGDKEDTDPLYVIRLEADKRQVIVGPRASLAKTSILLRETNWLGGVDLSAKAHDVFVKIRSTMAAIPATLLKGQKGQWIVDFIDPQYGVSAGQACVIYKDTQVVGGGWITYT